MQHIYFAKEPTTTRKPLKLVSYTHSLTPSRRLQKEETVHIDLLQDEKSLFSSISKRNQQMLKRAQKEQLQVVLYDNPTCGDLVGFQQYYNRFAKKKGATPIEKYHMQTLEILRDKGAILLSKVQSICGQVLCYRLDIVDGKTAMSRYVATSDSLVMPEELKQPIRFANRYLLWENIRLYKQLGYEIYDMGGLSQIPTINQFKRGFGGQVVEVYSGYIAQSKMSALLLGMRKWTRQR
ncbi:MAG: hypothetical protein RR651_11550 [Lysinibacillus sp.]